MDTCDAIAMRFTIDADVRALSFWDLGFGSVCSCSVSIVDSIIAASSSSILSTVQNMIIATYDQSLFLFSFATRVVR